MTKTKFSFGALAVLLLSATVSACSSVDEPTPEAGSVSSQQLGEFEAGEAAKGLGVAIWRTDASTSAINGLDARGNVVAAFSIDGKAGVIHTTLPDSGTVSINDAAATTLSANTAAYLNAAKSDLTAAINSANSVPVGASADVDKIQYTYACYQLYSDCSITCLYGMTNGWWTACSCDKPAIECPTSPWLMALHYI